MDDKHAQQHEQAVNYWRSVEQQGRQDQAEAQQHIRDRAAGRGNGAPAPAARATPVALCRVRPGVLRQPDRIRLAQAGVNRSSARSRGPGAPAGRL